MDIFLQYIPRLHCKRFLAYAFSVFSSLFTLLEAITYCMDLNKIQARPFLYIFAAASVAIGLYCSYKNKKTVFVLPLTNTKLTVQFGDFFKAKGVKVIPANVFFDTDIGKHVSKTSLHGIFIEKIIKNDGDFLYSQIEEKLDDISHEIISRQTGRTKKYPIGTCALVKGKDEKEYLLLALADTDIATCTAFCDVSKMWTALTGLLETARTELNGRALCLPLIGGGLAKIGLPGRELLQLIILSIVCETKKQYIADEVIIVLHKRLYGEIDLDFIAQYWRHYHGV